MRDLDELLRTDGARWRTEQPGPHDLRPAAEEAVRGTRRRSRNARAALLASVAAVVLFGVGAVLFVVFRTPSTTPVAGAPKSVTVHGTKLPYVGELPWANPVADPHDPRVVYVFADNDAVHAGGDICYAQADRGLARRSGQTIVVTVAGYGIPIGSDGVCPALAHSPASVRVELPGPLGHRSLVDASGTAHPVLDPSTVPAPTIVPGSCRIHEIRWDERTGIASRTYEDASKFQFRCWIVVTYGTDAQIRGLGFPGGASELPMRIHGQVVPVWHFTNVDNAQYTLRWRLPGGKSLQLMVDSSPAHPFDRGEVGAIARSVR
jgi:hypothetical protein